MPKLSDLLRSSTRIAGPPKRPRTQYNGVREILHASHESVQELAKLYNGVVNVLDRVLSSIVKGSRDFEIDELRESAKRLLPEIKANARILLGLASQDYDQKILAHHSVNVFIIAIKAAELVPLGEEQQAAFGEAALLNDIGMAMVPQDIINKRGALSDREHAEVVKHPCHSADLLERCGSDLLCTTVLQTHERVDGRGYPGGLNDEAIHYFAKLLHAVDAFDAIMHYRPYRARLAPFEAMSIIRADIGVDFGTQAFRHLLKTVTPFPIGTLVRLNTHESGKVVDIVPGELLCPAIAVLTDSSGNLLSEGRFVDLSEDRGVFIEQAIVDEALHEKACDIF